MTKENKIICPKCGIEINSFNETNNNLKEDKQQLTFKEKILKFIDDNL